MNPRQKKKLTDDIIEKVGSDCSRESLTREPDIVDLFDSLVRHVGLMDNKDLVPEPLSGDREKDYLDDRYCADKMFVRKTQKPQRQRFLRILEMKEKKNDEEELELDYWRRIGYLGRRTTERRATILICFSAYAYRRTLKEHLAWFFGECFDEGIDLRCVSDELTDIRDKLITPNEKKYEQWPAPNGWSSPNSSLNINVSGEIGISSAIQSNTHFDVIQAYHANGEEIPHDVLQGIRTLADQDNAKACRIMGDCFYHGIGYDENEREAVKWYNRAQSLGDAIAMRILGWLHENRFADELNADDKAFGWYKKSVDSGYYLGWIDVGRCYAYGIGCPKNLEKAIACCRKVLSEEDDNMEATYWLNLFKVVTALQREKSLAKSEDVHWAEKQLQYLSKREWSNQPLEIGDWINASVSRAKKILTFFYSSIRTMGMTDALANDVCLRVRYCKLSFCPQHMLAEIEFYSGESNKSRFCSAVVGPKSAIPLDGRSNALMLLGSSLLRLKSKSSIESYLKAFCEFNHSDSGSGYHLVTRIEDIERLVGGKKTIAKSIFASIAKPSFLNLSENIIGVPRYAVAMIHNDSLFTATLLLRDEGRVTVIDEGSDIVENVAVFGRECTGIFYSEWSRQDNAL